MEDRIMLKKNRGRVLSVVALNLRGSSVWNSRHDGCAGHAGVANELTILEQIFRRLATLAVSPTLWN
jgi:hypothetical protein